MKFQDMEYSRLSYEELQRRYRELSEMLAGAESREDFERVMEARQTLWDDMTVMTICSVRHDMNINDEFYAAEQAYYDEIAPRLSELCNQFNRQLMESPFQEELRERIGEFAYVVMEQEQRSFCSGLIPLQQEENALIAQYAKLTANATVSWEGREIKRNNVASIQESTDREVRKRMAFALSDSWESQRAELEDIYDKLVKNRDRQAKQLGYRNYVEMAYVQKNRIGYGPKEVARFREEVKRTLAPRYVEQEEKRRERIKLDHLYVYDSPLHFLNGNPKPVGDDRQCMETARRMFEQMSPETAEFIDYLMDNGLYDVEIRDGKVGGGYMTTFEKYRAPFIFANFDGTSENVYIISHEGGHAFQGYLKREEPIRERCGYTSEIAETHAMAMEFWVWPYLELFFGERTKDYRTQHLEGALQRILYQCEQDEFQQLVYEHPEMTQAERNKLWRKLEGEYFPAKDYGGIRNLEDGCSWQRIPHAFYWPFYAIEYGLAQVCALEYKHWMEKDKKAAWESYLTFCRNTGLKSFPELIKEAGLENPFEEGALERALS